MAIVLRCNANRIRATILILMAIAAMAAASMHLRADEAYARNRDYDLQHSKIALRFDVEQKKVIGDVTHTLTILRDGTPKIAFDSVGLTIQSSSFPSPPRRTTATSSMSKFATTENPPRDYISSYQTRTIPIGPSRYGRKANPKTPATISPPTTIRTTG